MTTRNRRTVPWIATAIAAAGAFVAPAAAAPDCRQKCIDLTKALYDDCILMGGDELDCQRQANEFKLSCLHDCPPENVTFPLVLCQEMEMSTNRSVGNGFPWENSAFFFANYRHQYLYPSDSLRDLEATGVTTIESLSSRASSFSGASTNVYAEFTNGDPSTIELWDVVSDQLVSTFAENTTGGTLLGRLESFPGDPIVIETITGPNGSLLSSCVSCPDGDSWFLPIDLFSASNLLVDTTMSIGTGNAGGSVWDTTSQIFGASDGCAGPERAFHSGTFEFPVPMDRALGIDDFAFVWVFSGTAPGRMFRLDGQIQETIRMLVTEPGLRASGLAPGRERRTAGLAADYTQLLFTVQGAVGEGAELLFGALAAGYHTFEVGAEELGELGGGARHLDGGGPLGVQDP